MVVNVPALITLIILTVAVILVLFNVTRPDLIALLVLISLGLTSVIAPADLFSGFSRSAVITVMALFIMTNALYRTGVTRWMGERFDASGPNFLTAPRSGVAPLSVVFTDTSTAPQPITARLWTFGDGARLRQVIAGVPTTYTQDLAAPLPAVLQSKTDANATRYVYALGTRPLAQYGGAWEYLLADAWPCPTLPRSVGGPLA